MGFSLVCFGCTPKLFYSAYAAAHKAQSTEIELDIKGVYGLGKSPNQIWDLLNDPAFLAEVVPGCKQFDPIADDQYAVQSKFAFGPLSLSMKGKVTLERVDPPRTYKMLASAKSFLGPASGEATINLIAIPGGTAFCYQARFEAGSGLANAGAKVISGTVDALSARFFERLANKMETSIIDVPLDFSLD